MNGAAPRPSATADLHHAAHQVAELARDALDLATPGPRIDVERAKRKLRALAAIAGEAAGE